MNKVTLFYRTKKYFPLNENINIELDADLLETKQSLNSCREFYQNKNQFLYEFEVSLKIEDVVNLVVDMNKGSTTFRGWLESEDIVFTKRHDIKDFYNSKE